METIGYLGPEGSYSHIAASRMRPSAKLRAFPGFLSVMASLTSGRTDGVVLPIENSLNGGVMQNIDLLQETEGVVAVEEMQVRIDHRLAVKAGTEERDVRRIYSHRQALEQCSKYLFRHFPDAKLIETASTAASLQKIVSKEDAGIVGAHMRRDGLILSEENISDERNNFTRFLLVRRGAVSPDAHSRRIYFSVTCPNVAGGLVALLQPIGRHAANMTKIESRPIKDCREEYRFFIEIEGDYRLEEIRLLLDEMKRTAKSFKLLGCY